jgi:hypothetical protein
MNRRELLTAGVALPFALALDPLAVAARLKGSPVALVTADLESHVVVLDLAAARPMARIETGPGPRAIESIRGRFGSGVVVAHTEHGVVSIVGSESLSLRAELDAFAAPRYACGQPWHGSTRDPLIAYVTDSAAREVVALDVLGCGRVLWRTSVPGEARHLSISPDGTTIWASLGTTAERIAILDVSDARRPRFVRTLVPPFLAHDVVFAPDGRHVWVTSGSERQIAMYRAGRPRPVRILAAGAPPQHVAFSGGKAFVASGDDGTVRRHRLDGSLVREASVPLGSYNVSFGGGRLVTPSLGRGTVAVLDSNGRVRTVRQVARAAHDACVVGD